MAFYENHNHLTTHSLSHPLSVQKHTLSKRAPPYAAIKNRQAGTTSLAV